MYSGIAFFPFIRYRGKIGTDTGKSQGAFLTRIAGHLPGRQLQHGRIDN